MRTKDSINGLIITAALAFSVVCSGIALECADYMGYNKAAVFAMTVCTVVLGFGLFWLIKCKKFGSKLLLNRYFISALLAFNALVLPDLPLDIYEDSHKIPYFLLGYLLTLIIFLSGAAFFSKKVTYKIWNTLWTVFFGIYAFAQYYIWDFRGAPIRFSDLANITSGLEVSDSYSFSLTYSSVFILLDIICVLIITWFVNPTPCGVKGRLISGCTALASAVCLIISSPYAYDSGIRNRYISMGFNGIQDLNTYRFVGLNLMFYYDALYNQPEEPDNYSDKEAEDILNQYTQQSKAAKTPTIIGIMNESFADFSYIADFKTNKDYLPNYRKLCSESISGYVSVSAYGGYSCNSEYEFLTGDTMGFLPSGSAAFTQYLNTERDSIVDTLNSLGYYTEAFTPCSSDLWNIGTAYKNLGFKNSKFQCVGILDEPGEINGNTSDKSLYRKLEQRYEEKKHMSPCFFWVTTMQNHGPYDNEDPAKGITLNDIDNPEAECYLSSLSLSDQALGELIEYFRKQQDEVIIVMFGDHYPHIMDFTEELYGRSVASLSTAEYSKLHHTPFLIWSNKGLQAKKIDDISLNYLSNEVWKAAGLPLSPYQQALEDIRQDIPVISGYGYKTSDGEWHTITEDSAFDETKNRYNILEYYRIFRQHSDS